MTRAAAILAFVVGLAAFGCGEKTGVVEVTYRIQLADGSARSCADIGAEIVELRLFARADDALAYDLTRAPCESDSNGEGVISMTVSARDYDLVRVTLLDGLGETVDVCPAGGGALTPASYETQTVVVPKNQTVAVDIDATFDASTMCP